MNSFVSRLRHGMTGLVISSAVLATAAHAGLTQVYSRGALPTAGQQTISWAGLGGDLTGVGASPTVGGVTVTGASSFTVMQQAPTGTWNGDFAATDTALVMFNANSFDFTGGVFDIALGGSFGGFGVQVNSLQLGAWLMNVVFYNAANVQIGSFDNLAGSTTDLQDGSAYFLGALSSASDIARVVISGLGDGAAINQLTLSPRGQTTVPEPGTVLLALLALGLMASLRRRA